jgi:hypothetical protein
VKDLLEMQLYWKVENGVRSSQWLVIYAWLNIRRTQVVQICGDPNEFLLRKILLHPAFLLYFLFFILAQFLQELFVFILEEEKVLLPCCKFVEVFSLIEASKGLLNKYNLIRVVSMASLLDKSLFILLEIEPCQHPPQELLH